MRNRKYILWALIVIGLYWTAAALTGCYTAKKAEQQGNKANYHHPGVVAKLARDKYPCTDLLKPDTAVMYRDTTVYIDCPDSIPATFEVVRRDTINNVVTKTIRVPVNLPIRERIITKWYEDSAKLKLAQIDLNGLQDANDKLTRKNEALSTRIKTRTKLMWLFVIIAACLTAWTFRKLFI